MRASHESLSLAFFLESVVIDCAEKWSQGGEVRRSEKKPSFQWHSGSLTWKFDFERGSLLHQLGQSALWAAGLAGSWGKDAVRRVHFGV